jgi:lipid II:glycine glycyltransferase (peptidoglycan interpeptide bridge formation enzyme)
MAEGLERVIAVEQSGWKLGAGIGVARNQTHRNFNLDLHERLAARGAVSLHFLKAQGRDVAALVNFTHRGVAYMKHTAYAPSHSEFSPGVVLLAEVARQLFGNGLREYDLLGMREDNAPVRYKAQWAPHRRETIGLRGYRVYSRLIPWLVVRALYKRVQQLLGAWRSRTRPERSA